MRLVFVRAVPSEATFSRAFAAFAESSLPSRLHEALVARTLGAHLVGHISRDSTAIEAREKPAPKAAKAPKPTARRGRPRKGEERPKEPSMLERQQGMELCEMLDELPKACDVGRKRNAKGHGTFWIGYKLHLDVADGSIPVSCILTSASVHDSQVAIPLATMTSERVDSLYHVMDSAYNAREIRDHCLAFGHVPIIDTNPRRSAERKQEKIREAKARRSIGYTYPEAHHYAERSTVERVNGRLRVRSPAPARAGTCKILLPLNVWSPGADREPTHEIADLILQPPSHLCRNPALRPEAQGAYGRWLGNWLQSEPESSLKRWKRFCGSRKNTPTASQNLPGATQRSIKRRLPEFCKKLNTLWYLHGSS